MSRATNLNQVDGAGDVGVDDVPDVVELLLEEGAAEAVAGVGEQRVDGAAPGRGIELIDAVLGREIDVERVDFGAGAAADLGDLEQPGGVGAPAAGRSRRAPR